MKMLCVGPLWRGSNAGGLFRAFSRNKVIIEVIDEFYYISLKSDGLLLKALHRVIRSRQIRNFNKEIINQVNLLKPDILFVYKGAFIDIDTLKRCHQAGCKLVNFYPDVSIHTHGKFLPKTIHLYDLVITTKSFGLVDLKNAGVKNIRFVAHGFDPEIHRQIPHKFNEAFACDVSFIGTWSPKKERLLSSLKAALPEVTLFIWGDQWNNCKSPFLKPSIKGRSISGDLYALAIQGSKINLGILSEVVVGASSGDKITSRTFHIPASGGFLLHERNDESIMYFDEGTEAAFFDTADELVKKVSYFLNKEDERLTIQKKGCEKVTKYHSLDMRAREIINLLNYEF